MVLQVVKNQDTRWNKTFEETRGFARKKVNVPVISEGVTVSITTFLGDKNVQLMVGV